MNHWRQVGIALGLVLCSSACAEDIEVLALDIISYEDFIQEDPVSLQVLQNALLEKGIVGVRGVPGYKERVLKFIETAQAFSALPEDAKEAYAPKSEEAFLGYERGKEKFQRPDGSWVVDDLKVSYYAFVPENPQNKWPHELDLQSPFLDLGDVMRQMGLAVMQTIGLLNYQNGICLDDVPRVGRMLYYRKSENTIGGNPFWCGAHFDHSLFTTLLPAFYFSNGEAIPEPIEAGLFVKSISDGVYRKVVANDPDVLLFQVGEFGQLVSNDAIRATEHRVHKAYGNVERYTMALFCDAPMDTVIHSTSVLTQDPRYGAKSGEACSYQHWNAETFKRFHVDKSE
jgi:isopenicillin N synthase-like dioxygenase